MTEREAERKVLKALDQYGPLFNGSLGAITGFSWRSQVFRRMEVYGLITGHPFSITAKGRAVLRDGETTRVTGETK